MRPKRVLSFEFWGGGATRRVEEWEEGASCVEVRGARARTKKIKRVSLRVRDDVALVDEDEELAIKD